MAKDVRTEADRLRSDRRPFVAATVVRAERPTSAKAGDTALVLDDGTIVGFVGGECAEANVQTHALSVLSSGEPLLLRITPDAPEPGDAPSTDSSEAGPGAVTVHNPCLSGGTLEIFLEPEVPPPLIVIHGDAPIARAVRDLAEWMGYESRHGDELPDDVEAVIVASHGSDETAILRAAVDAGVAYIGLVASPKRGAAVLDSLGLSDDERQRIKTPAGLDLGSRTPEEIALSILAEIVARRRQEVPHPRRSTRPEAEAPDPGAKEAIDPVCGMSVVVLGSTRYADHDGIRYWFCGSGCEQAFRADPSSFLGT